VAQEDPLQAALRRAMERASGAMPPVSPAMRFELRRKLLHVVVAVVAVPLILLVPLEAVMVLAISGILVITLVWAVDRRYIKPDARWPRLHEPLQKILRATRRPGEDFPWSPVLYTVALILIGLAHLWLGLSWAIAFAAFAILGLGDAASALVGVAYGRTKLAWNRKKSWEGTFAGFVAGALAGLVMASVPFAFKALPIPPAFFGVVLVGAAAGALAETIPRVEDNLVVPLAAAGTMFGLAAALSLPLP
jgi:dolichol kinase